MIRRGRKEGWLKLPTSALPAWSAMNNITYNGVKIGHLPGYEDRGSTVIAARYLNGGEEAPLIHVSRDMVLSLELVHDHAKSDQDFREVIAALGEFGRVGETSRGAILTFILMQAFTACPMPSKKRGVTHPFSEYIKFLPEELLPTFWSESERALLIGTTLRPALEAKMKSLYREFDLLRASTKQISWCRDLWWDEIEGLIDYDDWKQCDAMYRSRALEFPGIGDSMVAGIDMANHASGEMTGALYETDSNGDAILLLLDQKHIGPGDEVTITYGDKKGACEMLFSYGFIEDSMTSAREMFLDLEIPDDDPLKRAKNAIATTAPGFRLYEDHNATSWESDYVWLICVNEEDGLRFQIVQSIDGDQELQISWQGKEIDDIQLLRPQLLEDARWDIFQLRAVTVIQSRVESQLLSLSETDDKAISTTYGENTSIRPKAYSDALKLRSLERKLLEQAYENFEQQKSQLLQSDTVHQYLASAAREGPGDEGDEEDFS
ncbi:SET domain-containing protein [Viridothelium virens]|uniref:SET domain-containing protein n=1 Tax=Viridothelium virens TaxID=1048519 RepID=A0A6A6HIT6_VIRVR|nr:SET domain-containing protein [Viridothelium virens]